MPYGLLIFTLTTVHIRCRQFIIVKDNHWEHNLVVTCNVNASPLFPVPIPPDLIEGGCDETWHYSFCPDWENINKKIERVSRPLLSSATFICGKNTFHTKTCKSYNYRGRTTAVVTNYIQRSTFKIQNDDQLQRQSASLCERSVLVNLILS